MPELTEHARRNLLFLRKTRAVWFSYDCTPTIDWGYANNRCGGCTNISLISVVYIPHDSSERNRVPDLEIHRFPSLQTAVPAASFPTYSKDLYDCNYLGLFTFSCQYCPDSLLLKHFLFSFSFRSFLILPFEMFSPFCMLLAFYRHFIRITFSDTLFNDAYFAYALQIGSTLYRKHFAHTVNNSVGNDVDWPRLTSSCSIRSKLTESTLCVCVYQFQRQTILHYTVQSAVGVNGRKAPAYIACWKTFSRCAAP